MQTLLGTFTLVLPLMALMLHSVNFCMQRLLQVAHAGCRLCKQELSHSLFPCLVALILACQEDMSIVRRNCTITDSFCALNPVET